MMLINGAADDRLEAGDRGLAFGDGVFRTLACVDGAPRLWPWQYACLARDATRLGLPVPGEALLLAELRQACTGLPRAVAKITLTRGSGLRGYAIPADATATRIVAAHAWPGYPEHYAQDGVALTWCTLRLGLQPRLAGIKHLNRLENVLARSDLSDTCVEGLLCDSDGLVIEGTLSNLFVLRDGQWRTPQLDRCGVAGAMRAWVMARLPVEEARLRPADVTEADLLFVCNSLAGIWPVADLDGRRWRDFQPLRPLQWALAQEYAVAATQNRL
ncbi:MAG: aminodeoxychorismate lyase [Paludibacterium sp.]|uniref:aminodeoxychorismate lyase n=1 Tax=Paludibacterium sp. TaxID=1917523 RepID=UPI0025E03552|nr:aminodeoxychorismate lyase [Paludibacterium sp.]MBV8047842.1 aminodeoxychorismate lyase [Paludibacterium sp.]MBV8648136.1 aminodeoxychorismate lyase [Paludibacterium sp.]